MTEEARPLWEITGVTDRTVYEPGQGYVAGKQVTVRMYDGAIHNMQVPLSDYNAQTVMDHAHTAALKHKQVMELSGPDTRFEIPQTPPKLPDVIP